MSVILSEEFKCPFCDEKFEADRLHSCTIRGYYLDFKPFGGAGIPSPVPKCPKCNFVSFEGQFTENEIARLKKIFKANNIFELEPDMPEYYYLAKEYELLHKDIEKIIEYYHSAMWQKYKFSNTIAKIIIKKIEERDNNSKNYYKYQLVRIDYLRRLKQFESGFKLIDELKRDINFHPKRFKKLLNCQLDLIKNNDYDEYKMPEYYHEEFMADEVFEENTKKLESKSDKYTNKLKKCIYLHIPEEKVFNIEYDKYYGYNPNNYDSREKFYIIEIAIYFSQGCYKNLLVFNEDIENKIINDLVNTFSNKKYVIKKENIIIRKYYPLKINWRDKRKCSEMRKYRIYDILIENTIIGRGKITNMEILHENYFEAYFNDKFSYNDLKFIMKDIFGDSIIIELL